MNTEMWLPKKEENKKFNSPFDSRDNFQYNRIRCLRKIFLYSWRTFNCITVTLFRRFFFSFS